MKQKRGSAYNNSCKKVIILHMHAKLLVFTTVVEVPKQNNVL